MDLNGNTYHSKPIQAGPKPGFEGAAQAGQFRFNEGKVTFILPRSDEKSAGSYTVKGDSLVIHDIEGRTLSFSIREGGKVLLSNDGSEEYRRADYPWP